jgi:hypothetical protein
VSKFELLLRKNFLNKAEFSEEENQNTARYDTYNDPLAVPVNFSD